MGVDVSFIRRDSNIKSYDVSKAVDTIVNKPAKVQFLLQYFYMFGLNLFKTTSLIYYYLNKILIEFQNNDKIVNRYIH